MKKILLIQPKSPDTFWKLNGAVEITGKKTPIPPLGLLTVAALTPPKYHVQIFDEEVEEIDFDAECDLVGITGYTLHSQRMFEISEKFRERGILTVGGGPYCSSHPKDSADHFDVLMCGEGENIWSQFLADWEKNDHQKLYKGEEGLDLSSSPLPRWDLVKLKNYSAAMVQTSRGCPYDCEFCDIVSLFGRKNRHKPLENVMREVKLLEQSGCWEIFFGDDNFIGNRKFAKALLVELIELNKTLKKPLRFITQVTLNVAQDVELLDLFKRANFFSFFIGIESPKRESLIETNKGHNLNFDMKEAVEKIQSRGIFIISAMIVGFDSDDIGIFSLHSAFIRETGLTIPFVGILMAPKGTKLWSRLEKEGRLLPEAETGDTFNTSNFAPMKMGKKELEDNYMKLLKEVYSCLHFLKRFQSLIDQIDLKKVKTDSPLAEQMKLKNFRAFSMGVTFRLIRHFLFHRDKEMRSFFISTLKIAFKKGLVCFPLVIELLVYFKAQKEYVDRLGFNLKR
ncbi:MAG: radical SAM protein [Nitrospinota bacterium]